MRHHVEIVYFTKKLNKEPITDVSDTTSILNKFDVTLKTLLHDLEENLRIVIDITLLESYKSELKKFAEAAVSKEPGGFRLIFCL